MSEVACRMSMCGPRRANEPPRPETSAVHFDLMLHVDDDTVHSQAQSIIHGHLK